MRKIRLVLLLMAMCCVSVASAQSASFSVPDPSAKLLQPHWSKSITAQQKRVLQQLIDSMVRVDGGTFTMGATTEQECYFVTKINTPPHKVCLSNYIIGKTEVTQEQWESVMGSNPSYFKGSNLPVENVSWNDCQEFIKRLNQLTGMNFRLPTEAEWEYAARGGNKSSGYKYSGQDKNIRVAWYYLNSREKTHKVATKSSNELGLYDMSGNVWEWCSDWYGDYGNSSQINPTGSSKGSKRVMRGGSWSAPLHCCKVAYRSSEEPSNSDCYTGLRLVISVQ